MGKDDAADCGLPGDLLYLRFKADSDVSFAMEPFDQGSLGFEGISANDQRDLTAQT